MKYGKVFQCRMREDAFERLIDIGVAAGGYSAGGWPGALKWTIGNKLQGAATNADEKLREKWPKKLGYEVGKAIRLRASFALRYFPRLREGQMDDIQDWQKKRKAPSHVQGAVQHATDWAFGKGSAASEFIGKNLGAGAKAASEENVKSGADADIGKKLSKQAKAKNEELQKRLLQRTKGASPEEVKAGISKMSATGQVKQHAAERTAQKGTFWNGPGYAQADAATKAAGAEASASHKAEQAFKRQRFAGLDPSGQSIAPMVKRAQAKADMTPEQHTARATEYARRKGMTPEARAAEVRTKFHAGTLDMKDSVNVGKAREILAGKYGVKSAPKSTGVFKGFSDLSKKWGKTGLAAMGVYAGGKGILSAASGAHAALGVPSNYAAVQDYHNQRAALGNISMNVDQSIRNAASNLRENAKTWATRKSKYGPSGRKNFKFDFNKPSHVKKALQLKSDDDVKKLMKSTADITKHQGMKTKDGVLVKYAYRSNSGKQLYAGKTIGMRQKVISDHGKLGLPLPKNFENFSFDKVNAVFKKNKQQGWYKRNYGKASIPRKALIGLTASWKKLKQLFNGKSRESEIEELGDFMESSAPVTCTFMTGEVGSPVDCVCADCLAVSRKLQEGESSRGELLHAGVIADPGKPLTKMEHAETHNAMEEDIPGKVGHAVKVRNAFDTRRLRKLALKGKK